MNVKPRSFCRRALRRVVLASVAAGLAGAVPAVTRADRPTTIPAIPGPQHSDRKDHPDHDRRPDRDKADGRDRGDRSDRPGPRREKVTEEQWKATAAFMEANSPNLWDFYEKLPEPHKTGAKWNIFHRYMGLQKLQKQDESLYNVELKRVKAEDEIFGIMGEFRKSRRAPQQDREQLEQRLRDKVHELWVVRMEDRDLQLTRIERQLKGFGMEKALAALRDERQEEAGRKEQWVEEKVAFYLRHASGRPGGRGKPPEGSPAKEEGGDDRDHKREERRKD